MAEAYQFEKQLAKGKEVERRLDLFFASQFDAIEEVDMASERQGIDRIYHKGDRAWTIEYKADWKSHRTGNFFADTVAYGTYDDSGTFIVGKPGWVFTTTADYLIYTVMLPDDEPDMGIAYVVEPKDLRSWMDVWEEEHRSVTVRNQGFQGRGLLVPITELERLSARKIAIT